MAARTRKKRGSPRAPKVFGNNGVLYTFPEGEGGPIEIKVDFGVLPTPANYYYADAVALRVDRELRMAILSFGRRAETADKLADRIDVVMPSLSLFGQFWLSSRDVEQTIQALMEALGAVPNVRAISSAESVGMTFFANMIHMAVGEAEASLDFYHLSPRDVHLAKTRKANMQIQPVVRVIVAPVLAKHFFDQLRPHVDQRSTLQQVRGGKVGHAAIAD